MQNEDAINRYFISEIAHDSYRSPYKVLTLSLRTRCFRLKHTAIALLIHNAAKPVTVIRQKLSYIKEQFKIKSVIIKFTESTETKDITSKHNIV